MERNLKFLKIRSHLHRSRIINQFKPKLHLGCLNNKNLTNKRSNFPKVSYLEKYLLVVIALTKRGVSMGQGAGEKLPSKQQPLSKTTSYD